MKIGENEIVKNGENKWQAKANNSGMSMASAYGVIEE